MFVERVFGVRRYCSAAQDLVYVGRMDKDDLIRMEACGGHDERIWIEWASEVLVERFESNVEWLFMSTNEYGSFEDKHSGPEMFFPLLITISGASR